MSQLPLADCARENARALVTVFATTIGLVAIVCVVVAQVLFASHLFSPLTLLRALALGKGAIGLHLAIILGVLALTPFGLLFGMSSRIAKTRPGDSAVMRRVCRIFARRVEDNRDPSTAVQSAHFDVLPLQVSER